MQNLYFIHFGRLFLFLFLEEYYYTMHGTKQRPYALDELKRQEIAGFLCRVGTEMTQTSGFVYRVNT